jgi:hypothetical protein
MIPIDRLERPTAGEFRRCAAAGKPFVIRHAADHWKALTAWTPEYLRTRAGDAPVPVLTIPDGKPVGRFFYGGNTAATVTFGDCLPLLDGAPARFYMAGVPISAHLPMLADDLGRLEFVDDRRQRQRQIWISGRNSKGPLHFDLDDNVHVVVTGRKRFFLFEYAEIDNLYVFPAFSATPHYCRVDAQEPDFDRFPRFRLARGYEVTLERGEMLFIPQGCWHQVVTEEPSVAINFWLGKKIFQRATWRVLANLSVRLIAGIALAPLRSLGTRARTGGTATPSGADR